MVISVFAKNRHRNFDVSCSAINITDTSCNCFKATARKLSNRQSYMHESSKPLITGNYKISIENKHFVINDKKSGKLLTLESRIHKIAEWNHSIDWSDIKYFIVPTSRASYLVAISRIAGASGLGVNFRTIIVIDLNNGYFFWLDSLSTDSRFFYEKNGFLNFYLFDYSKSFLENLDYDHISFQQQHYLLRNDKIVLVGTKPKTCDCK